MGWGAKLKEFTTRDDGEMARVELQEVLYRIDAILNPDHSEFQNYEQTIVDTLDFFGLRPLTEQSVSHTR